MSGNVAANHADWLALADPVGPFLTLPVLRRVWGSGLDRTAAPLRAELRDRVETLGRDEADRREFVEWVLRRLLQYGPTVASGQQLPDQLTVTIPEHGTILRPDFAIVQQPADGTGVGRARMLVSLWPVGTDPAAHVVGENWAASPVDRMVTHCRLAGTELGLVTDGDRFTLVWAPPTGPAGRASWAATVFAEAAERTFLDSFTSVIGAKRLFSVAGEDQLEAILTESASAQAEVTNQLGKQVRQSVELLVGAFSRADREKEGVLLANLDPHFVYEAACTVMMRLVFLLYAEERRLLPLGDELYDRSYAASTLRQTLRDTADAIGNDETLEHSHTAWPRLLALFRAVHAGLAHDELRLPAYGGRLFDPDRYAFLEGRCDDESWRDVSGLPIAVDDRTVLAVLTKLQILELREGGVVEARRLTFRSLDVEQIGHVYEGLLDHGARRIDQTAVGLIGKPGAEPEVTVADLDAEADRGDDTLAVFLATTTGRSVSYIATQLARPVDENRLRRLRVACDNDSALVERIRRYMPVLRDDLRDLPTVFLDGSVYVTEVSLRRDSGTEYTTKDLADEVVRFALEPLVFSPGPAEGAEPADWVLKSAEDILSLRVCDPAVGSGAILTAACRYLGDRLLEAWQRDGKTTAVDADPTDDVDDLVVDARRAVAERCLYGVDRDPMAVEMAKLSLWLVTMARERPFSFLDHAIRPGDSLLGVTRIEQITRFHIDPSAAQSPFAFAGELGPLVKEALELRQRLESSPVVEVRDVEEKTRLLAAADRLMELVTLAGDLVIGAALSTASGTANDYTARLSVAAADYRRALDDDDDDEAAQRVARLRGLAATWLNEGRPKSAPTRRPFHWPVAFPEVFSDGEASGFDAIIGNPPFLHGQKMTGRLGVDFREHLVERLADGTRGSADLVAYFFRRAFGLQRNGGHGGLLATNTISEGDTLEVGLAPLVADGMTITRAVRTRRWPGAAALEVALVWWRRGPWDGSRVLDGATTEGAITARLVAESAVRGEPTKLIANKGIGFRGTIILGMGFTVSPDEASAIIGRDPKSSKVLRPYLSADDILGRPDLSPSRWVIDFKDMPVDEARKYSECFGIVERLVRPEREKARGRNPIATARADTWWQFASYTKSLYAAIGGDPQVIVIPNTSKFATPARVASGMIFSNSLVVIARSDDDLFGILSSNVHTVWMTAYTSTMRNFPRYSPSDVFDTFPLPANDEGVASAAARLEGVRAAVMTARSQGLTKLYNAFHDSKDTSDDVAALRELHSELDQAVVLAYGWDLDLGHDFRDTVLGERWTVSEGARRFMLDRLLELNHERRASEPAAKSKRPSTRKLSAQTRGQTTMFEAAQEEADQ